MTFISPLLSMSVSQATITAVSTTSTTLAASVANDFFTNIFMHPGENFYAIMIIGGVVVAGFGGLAFLIMKVYQKVFPQPK